MANKPNILATFKSGQAVGAVDHYVETMNWLIGFVSNLKAETGIEIKNPKSDHPSITAKVIAGKGIKVEESGGAWKISLKEGGGGDDDDDGGSGKGKGKTGSGGSGSGSGGAGSGGSGSGSGTGGNGATGGSGGSGSGGNGGGGTTGGSGNGSSCNEFSADIENDNDDSGMDNMGDDCAELNGW